MTVYNQDSIKTIPFGMAVRTKLGMYLSADLDEALVLGLRELIYNATDEYEQGFGSHIGITIITDKDNQIITIRDNARGIPVGLREDGTNSLVAAFTIPHSGAKHDNEVYAGAVGINGIGAKVVCHTSEWMNVEVHNEGLNHSIIFEETDEGAVVTVPLTSKPYDFKKYGTGTYISYSPSKKIYGDRTINIDKVRDTLRELSYFTKGMKFTLQVDEHPEEVFLSKNGLADALNTKERVHKNALYYNSELAGVKVELALQWCKHDSFLHPYANNLYVQDGGAFMTGFKTSLTKAFNSVVGKDFSGDIIRKYLDGYVSVKVGVPQFSNQSKTSLANPEARTAASTAITEAFKQFANNYPLDIEKIVELMDKEQRAEIAAQRARDAVASIIQGQKKAKMITNLPVKLADANGNGYKEIFIVEGDSAAGTLKMVRNHETQAVLPLRGKVLNTFDKELSEIIQNNEIKDMLMAFGCGVGELTNTKNMRYNKVIIATDRDPDGHHISLLLMSFFLKHLRPLVEAGMIYRVITPFHKVIKNGKTTYLYSDEEFNEWVKVNGTPDDKERFKGLGAHDKFEIQDFLVSDETRKLEQLSTNNMEETLRLFNAMMGSNLELRKILIRTGGDYE